MDDPTPESALPRLPAPPARRRGFALTPLADVMFQLLLFFMLTSSLAPYALLPLRAAAPSVAETQRAEAPPSQSPAPPAQAQVIWHLERGEIRAGDARISLAALPDAVDALRRDAVSDLVVFVTVMAQATDLARLIEAVQGSGIARVQLVGS